MSHEEDIRKLEEDVLHANVSWDNVGLTVCQLLCQIARDLNRLANAMEDLTYKP